MFDFRKKLGLIALVCSIAGLASCGGGSGTDNDKPVLVSCTDPLVLQDDGTCGEPRDPYVPPPCPEGQIRSGAFCVIPDFPEPLRKPGPNEAIIFVNVDLPTSDKITAFAGYNLHLWQSCGDGWGTPAEDRNNVEWAIPTEWPAGPAISSLDTSSDPTLQHDPVYGAYFVLPISATGTCGNFIIKTPGAAAQTGDLRVEIKRDDSAYDRMAWVIVNTTDMRNSRFSNIPICINDDCSTAKSLLGISGAEAHWLDADTVVWDREYTKVELYRSAEAGMIPNEDGTVSNGTLVGQLSAARSMTDEEIAMAPHLDSYFAYDLGEVDAADAEAVTESRNFAKALLKEELLVVGRYNEVIDDVDTELGRGTRVQTAIALDSLYAEKAKDKQLGISYEGDSVKASLWAPNAQNVELRIYTGEPLRVSETVPLQLDNETGIWSYTGTKAQFDRKHYRFRVQTYNPVAKRVHRLEVTDPYSVALSTNSRYSLFVNFNDTDVKPDGWDTHLVPTVTSPEAMSIYEVHVRDFSANDQSTSPAYRGKYMAFTQTDSAPVQHLQSLVDAGLTHVHFLPTNNFTNVNEQKSAQITLESYVFQLCQAVDDETSVFICTGERKQSNTATLREVLESFDPTTDDARRLIGVFNGLDNFNWGYDPYHFNAPEGSYATDPEGVARIKEMRAMNKALHEMGLRVVMDVVYPHTYASSETSVDSVFDKIIPGYYYRTNPATGEVENGTQAGADTATERTMMAKFVTDSLVHWSSNYKVDGFRFDQSGFMPKSLLVDSLAAVQAIDSDTYFYAEAWTPGGGTSGDRIEGGRATQAELAGTGIGTFNDRIRDPLQQLNLFNGRGLDAIRVGLAGNLRDFKLKASNGAPITGEAVRAYNLDPQEAINYVEKHDNETLWDWIHRPIVEADAAQRDIDRTEGVTYDSFVSAENISLANRVRMHGLTLSIPLLSQGVPFIHMGSDLLRSKSLSPNSYNAGDWFNAVDFTKQSNNWAVGLPPELRANITDGDVLEQFEDPESTPTPEDIAYSSDVFNEFLTIASSSSLFSLQSAEEVMDRLGFHDGGKTQKAGLIVMSIDDGVGIVDGTESTARADLDENLDAIVVIVNGTSTSQTALVPTSTGFTLHPVQASSADPIVKTSQFTEAVDDQIGGSFTVPAYTTAVFVKLQDDPEVQGEGLSARATLDIPDEDPPTFAHDIYVRGELVGEWGAGPDNIMEYHGRGIYSRVIDIPTARAYSFKFAAEVWDNVNIGFSNVTVETGSLPLVNVDGNMNVTIPAAGRYRFELDASNLDGLKARVFLEPFPDAVYIRGSVVDGDWTASAINRLAYEGKGIYGVNLDVAQSATAYNFKVAAADWADLDLGNSSAPLVLGESLPLVTPNGNTNISLTIAETGTYHFEVNSLAPSIRVFKDDIYEGIPIYVRGNVFDNDWTATTANQMTYKGHGLYSVSLDITGRPSNYEFKVANAAFSGTPNLGGSSATLGTPTALIDGGGGNVSINIPDTGSYTFTLDTSKANAITITVDSE